MAITPTERKQLEDALRGEAKARRRLRDLERALNALSRPTLAEQAKAVAAALAKARAESASG